MLGFDPSLILGVSSYGPEISCVSVLLPPLVPCVVVRYDEVISFGALPFQKDFEKIGLRMGMLTARIPTMVSRTPHALMVSADGFAESVRTTRVIAAAITNAPEERSSPTTSFLGMLEGLWGREGRRTCGRGLGVSRGEALEFRG